MKLLFLLLIVYQLKHFIADYLLQGEYMLGKFKPDWSFIKPLLAHVGVHAIFTFTIATLLVAWPIALGLALLDAIVHFTMDRVKAGHKYLGKYKPVTSKEYIDAKNIIDSHTASTVTINKEKNRLRSNVLFWWSLGLDQMVHHLTHYSIIYLIILFH